MGKLIENEGFEKHVRKTLPENAPARYDRHAEDDGIYSMVTSRLGISNINIPVTPEQPHLDKVQFVNLGMTFSNDKLSNESSTFS